MTKKYIVCRGKWAVSVAGAKVVICARRWFPFRTNNKQLFFGHTGINYQVSPKQYLFYRNFGTAHLLTTMVNIMTQISMENISPTLARFFSRASFPVCAQTKENSFRCLSNTRYVRMGFFSVRVNVSCEVSKYFTTNISDRVHLSLHVLLNILSWNKTKLKGDNISLTKMTVIHQKLLT